MFQVLRTYAVAVGTTISDLKAVGFRQSLNLLCRWDLHPPLPPRRRTD